MDVSHSCASGKNSGIERVVRSVIAECKQWCPEEGLPAPELVTHKNGCFYSIENGVRNHFKTFASIESNIHQYLPRWYKSLAKGICTRLKSARIKKWFLPEAGHLGAFKLPHNIYKNLIQFSLPFVAKPVETNANDLILLPDAYWTRRGVWDAVKIARQRGTTVATVIYDLIPLTHPQYVGTKRMEGFRRYLHHVIEHSDLVIAISRTVQEDVRDYIDQHRSEFKSVPSELRHFTLGAELKLVEGNVRPQVQELFPSNASTDSLPPPYLMVATFDPRKNHHYVLDTFDQLWKTRQDLRLCLIGRVGSLCSDVIDRIRSHPALNHQLFAFYDIKDAELQHCYQQCRGVISPSIVEGFGLPIVESLWFGKRTFASKTPIHCEVGGGDCVYFDLESPDSLAAEIVEWEKIADRPNLNLPTRKPTTWEASSRQLMAHCFEAFQAIHGSKKHSKAAVSKVSNAA